ncbi:MAG TPA: hypothetical protein DEP84_03775, partial [Chloroflexi bacterium]|nr:hypothetical protein [Chloroflexota bacterium]
MQGSAVFRPGAAHSALLRSPPNGRAHLGRSTFDGRPVAGYDGGMNRLASVVRRHSGFLVRLALACLALAAAGTVLAAWWLL